MNRTSSRIYDDDNDTQIMIHLMVKVRPFDHLDDYPTRVDIEEKLASAKIRANTRLWFDDEQLIGWAYVDDFNNLYWEFENPYDELPGVEVIAWGESCIRKLLQSGNSAALDATCRENDIKKISILKQYDFRQTQETSVIMMRPLSEPIADPELPPGFNIRPILGMNEAEAVATMHRAAFGTQYMTTEQRLIIMNTSSYDPSMDLVVVAPDGTIAAYCTCSVNNQTKIGFTDPVATHPNYQHMGLARALLFTGFRLLKERGMTSAHLGTDGDNIAMQKTAESAGFQIAYRTLWFTKEVHLEKS
jgi:Acetyltransferases